jgi:hypothetical protein
VSSSRVAYPPLPGALGQQHHSSHPQYQTYQPHLSSGRVVPAAAPFPWALQQQGDYSSSYPVHQPGPSLPMSGSVTMPSSMTSYGAPPLVLHTHVRPSGPPAAHPFLPPGHPLAQAQAPRTYHPTAAQAPHGPQATSALRAGASEFVSTTSRGGHLPHMSALSEHANPSDPTPTAVAAAGLHPLAQPSAAASMIPTGAAHAPVSKPVSQGSAAPVLPPGLASVLGGPSGNRGAQHTLGRTAQGMAPSAPAPAPGGTAQQHTLQAHQPPTMTQSAPGAEQQAAPVLQPSPSQQQQGGPPAPPRRVALQHRIAAQAIASAVRSSSVEAGNGGGSKGRPGSRPIPDPRIPYQSASPSSGASGPSSELMEATASPVGGSYHAPTPPPAMAAGISAGGQPGYAWSGAPV